MNLLIPIIFLYSIPNIRSHELVFSESDILNIVKNLEETIESEEKKTDAKFWNEECPCDEIQTDIEFLMIENNVRQEEIEQQQIKITQLSSDSEGQQVEIQRLFLENVEQGTQLKELKTENEQQQNLLDQQKENIDQIISRLLELETKRSGSVWFDAYLERWFDASDDWEILTYTNLRKASSYQNAMDIDTGKFTAPLAGTYQFIIQVFKSSDVYGLAQIVHKRINEPHKGISTIKDENKPNPATITGTAIIHMEVGEKVWAETYCMLNSLTDGIHFTGTLLSAD